MRFTSALFLALVALTSSCAPKTIAPRTHGEIFQNSRFAYTKDGEGRWYIFTSEPRALDEAMKKIRPGPATVSKVDVWVITPLIDDTNP